MESILRFFLCLNFLMGPVAFAETEEAIPTKNVAAIGADTVSLAKSLGEVDYANVRLQLRGKIDSLKLAQLDAAYKQLGNKGTFAQVLATSLGRSASDVAMDPSLINLADPTTIQAMCVLVGGALSAGAGKLIYNWNTARDERLQAARAKAVAKQKSCDSAMLDLKQRVSGGSVSRTAEANLSGGFQ